MAEAISRPTMRTVIPKTTAQLDLQALHRIRERIVSRWLIKQGHFSWNTD
ncbi:hypothetical protein [Brenneria alni]